VLQRLREIVKVLQRQFKVGLSDRRFYDRHGSVIDNVAWVAEHDQFQHPRIHFNVNLHLDHLALSAELQATIDTADAARQASVRRELDQLDAFTFATTAHELEHLLLRHVSQLATEFIELS
jgi:hypothetical protein